MYGWLSSEWESLFVYNWILICSPNTLVYEDIVESQCSCHLFLLLPVSNTVKLAHSHIYSVSMVICIHSLFSLRVLWCAHQQVEGKSNDEEEAKGRGECLIGCGRHENVLVFIDANHAIWHRWGVNVMSCDGTWEEKQNKMSINRAKSLTVLNLLS